MSRFMNKEEAAAYIGVAPATLQKLTGSKRIAHYGGGKGKKNGLLRFAQVDLDAYLETIRVEAEEPMPVSRRPYNYRSRRPSSPKCTYKPGDRVV